MLRLNRLRKLMKKSPYFSKSSWSNPAWFWKHKLIAWDGNNLVWTPKSREVLRIGIAEYVTKRGGIK